MGRFFSILIATFLSVLCALATWRYAENYLEGLEAKKIAAVIEAKNKKVENVTKEIVDSIRYEWKVEERTNPVTGEQVTTATRFSENIGSAITFRCYGLKKKRFDILVSFPDAIEWNSYKGSYSADMKFRVDKEKLSVLSVNRSSTSTAVPELKEKKNIEKEYKKYPSLLKIYREENRNIREFKRIASASLFEASIPDGTIYQQTISIDLEGVENALKPVLSLCEKNKFKIPNKAH
jgi:hypothetical protein